jgi:hypothetical protein
MLKSALMKSSSCERAYRIKEVVMNFIVDVVAKSGLLKKDLDYNLVRASMVIIFLFFGYQKWFQYEADVLIPYIGNGRLISWMYPVFGIRGASSYSSVCQSGPSARSSSPASGTKDERLWCPGLGRYLRRHGHNYSVHAG